MADNIQIVILILIAAIIFGVGSCCGIDDASRIDNQSVCKQLYQKDTNAYINCNTKSVEENIKLIKDISDDR